MDSPPDCGVATLEETCTTRHRVAFAGCFVLLHALILRAFAVPVDWKIVAFVGTHPGLFLLNLPMAGALGGTLRWATRIVVILLLVRSSWAVVKLVRCGWHVLNAGLGPFLRGCGAGSRQIAVGLAGICVIASLGGLVMLCAWAVLPALLGVRVLQW